MPTKSKYSPAVLKQLAQYRRYGMSCEALDRVANVLVTMDKDAKKSTPAKLTVVTLDF